MGKGRLYGLDGEGRHVNGGSLGNLRGWTGKGGTSARVDREGQRVQALEHEMQRHARSSWRREILHEEGVESGAEVGTHENCQNGDSRTWSRAPRMRARMGFNAPSNLRAPV